MSNGLRIAHTSEGARRSANRILASARARKPLQAVVWLSCEDGTTEVMISNGTDRTKAVGALTVAAYEMWNA